MNVRCGWAGSVPRIRGESRVPLLRRTKPDTKGRETEEKLERPRRNRVLSSPSSLNRAPVYKLRRLFLTSHRFSGEACNWWTVERKGTTPAIVALKYTTTGRSGSNSRMPDVVDSRSNRSELVHAPSLSKSFYSNRWTRWIDKLTFNHQSKIRNSVQTGQSLRSSNRRRAPLETNQNARLMFNAS